MTFSMTKLNLVLFRGWKFERDLADRVDLFVKRLVEQEHTLHLIGNVFLHNECYCNQCICKLMHKII